MLNWWLIVIAVVVALLILAGSIYFVVLFTAEIDRGTAWFPKVVVICGLFLSAVTILLLPFDVAARRDPASVKQFVNDEIDTGLMWQIVLWCVAIFIIVIIPFTTFYYEGGDPDNHSVMQQLGPALLYTFIIIVIAGVLFGLLWSTAGFSDMPYVSYNSLPQIVWVNSTSITYTFVTDIQRLPFQVSLFVYVAGLIAFFGWVLFLVYGSVGLSALPYDYFHNFITRPKPISPEEFEGMKAELASRAEGLLREVDKLHKEQLSRNNMAVRRKIDALKLEVYDLQNEYERKRDASDPTYVFWSMANGVVGIVAFGLSACWMLHILLWIAMKFNPFLNNLLVALDSAFSLLGVIAYAIFAFYLLWCSVKGCLKVGMRVPCLTIHPMKVGDTLMNAMLFNVGLILLTAVTVTQFTAMAFDLYTANSKISTLFGLFVKNLRGIGPAMFYFQFVFPLLSILCLTWVICCPQKKKAEEPPK